MGVHLFSLFRCSRFAGTYRPYGFVGYDERGELFGCQVIDHLPELCPDDVEVPARFAFFELFAHAVYRNEVVGVCHGEFPVERGTRFTVVFAPFRVAEDDVLHAECGQHGGRYFARVGSLLLGGTVLRTDRYAFAARSLHHLAEVGERRTDDEFHAAVRFVAPGCDGLGQFHSLCGQGIHFPVARNDFFSHYPKFLVCDTV